MGGDIGLKENNSELLNLTDTAIPCSLVFNKLLSVIELFEIKCLLNELTILTLSIINFWFTFKTFGRRVELFDPVRDFVIF